MIKFKIKNPQQMKLLIAKKGFTLRGFASYAGISHSYLSQIVNERTQPSARIASYIAKGLDTDLESLFFIIVVDEQPLREVVNK